MRLADLVLRARWLIVVLATTTIGGSLWIASGIEANYSFWTLFVSDDPEVVRLSRYIEQWGPQSTHLFVAVRANKGKVTTTENLAVLSRIESRVSEVPGIIDVVSPLTAVTARAVGDELVIGPLVDEVPITPEAARAFAEEALKNRLIAGYLLSLNERTALVATEIDPALADAVDRNPVVEEVTALAEELTVGTDLLPYVTGIPVAQWVYSAKLWSDLATFVGLATLLLASIMWYMFRSLVGLALPLLVVIGAASATVAIMVLSGQQLNMISTSIPTLMMVIGIADGIHLLSNYRQRLAAGDTADDATVHTFVHLGSACLLTSVTTAVGFASLMMARIAIVRDFGLYAAVGIMMAFIGNMLVIPVGLVILEPRIGYHISERTESPMVRALDRLARWVMKRPWTTLGLAATVLAIATWGAVQVEIESRMFEEVPDDDPVVRAHRRVEEDLPGVISYALDVTTESGGVVEPELLHQLDELALHAESHPAVDRAIGLAELLKQLNRATHGGDPAYDRVPDDRLLIAQLLMIAEGDATERLVDEERRRTRVWMRGPEVLTSVWEGLRADIEARIAALDTDAEIVVTGPSSMAKRALGAIIHDVLTSLLWASVIILLIMSLLFRSLRVGLVSMVPNLIPLLITVGIMGWFGIRIRTSTVVIFSISLGLAVDDTIHFMVRYCRDRATGRDVSAAMLNTFRSAGRPIVYTSLLMLGGFWILLFASFNATRDVGLLGGVTLLSALFADLVVLPAMLTLLPGVGAPRGPPVQSCEAK